MSARQLTACAAVLLIAVLILMLLAFWAEREVAAWPGLALDSEDAGSVLAGFFAEFGGSEGAWSLGTRLAALALVLLIGAAWVLGELREGASRPWLAIAFVAYAACVPAVVILGPFGSMSWVIAEHVPPERIPVSALGAYPVLGSVAWFALAVVVVIASSRRLHHHPAD